MNQQKFKKIKDIGIKDPDGYNVQDIKYNLTGEEHESNSDSETDSDDNNFIDDEENSSSRDETDGEQSERSDHSESEDCTPIYRKLSKTKKQIKQVELSYVKILQEEKDFVPED